MITLRISGGRHPGVPVCALWIKGMDIHRRFYPPVRGLFANKAEVQLFTASTERDLQGVGVFRRSVLQPDKAKRQSLFCHREAAGVWISQG